MPVKIHYNDKFKKGVSLFHKQQKIVRQMNQRNFMKSRKLNLQRHRMMKNSYPKAQTHRVKRRSIERPKNLEMTIK